MNLHIKVKDIKLRTKRQGSLRCNGEHQLGLLCEQRTRTFRFRTQENSGNGGAPPRSRIGRSM